MPQQHHPALEEFRVGGLGSKFQDELALGVVPVLPTDDDFEPVMTWMPWNCSAMRLKSFNLHVTSESPSLMLSNFMMRTGRLPSAFANPSIALKVLNAPRNSRRSLQSMKSRGCRESDAVCLDIRPERGFLYTPKYLAIRRSNAFQALSILKFFLV